jgi:hypothetical protein
MKNIAIILFVLSFGISQARYCCTGDYQSNSLSNGVTRSILCPTTNSPTQRCSSYSPLGSDFTTLGCADDTENPTFSYCSDDYCNCPANYQRPVNGVFRDMKKIMFPIMGVIFGILWVLLAFFGARLPVNILLLIVGLLNGVFGTFLIFLPITTFLGLFYIAVGAFMIAICRHDWGGNRGIDLVLALTVIIFLLTGGLTFIAHDWGLGSDYFSRVAGYIPVCDSDMGIGDDGEGSSARCGNYALFIAFCVYLLFLIQPIGMLAAAFKRVGHHSDTTVVVKEKHENK